MNGLGPSWASLSVQKKSILGTIYRWVGAIYTWLVPILDLKRPTKTCNNWESGTILSLVCFLHTKTPQTKNEAAHSLVCVFSSTHNGCSLCLPISDWSLSLTNQRFSDGSLTSKATFVFSKGFRMFPVALSHFLHPLLAAAATFFGLGSSFSLAGARVRFFGTAAPLFSSL